LKIFWGYFWGIRDFAARIRLAGYTMSTDLLLTVRNVTNKSQRAVNETPQALRYLLDLVIELSITGQLYARRDIHYEILTVDGT